jgi:hypothetical protein
MVACPAPTRGFSGPVPVVLGGGLEFGPRPELGGGAWVGGGVWRKELGCEHGAGERGVTSPA